MPKLKFKIFAGDLVMNTALKKMRNKYLNGVNEHGKGITGMSDADKSTIEWLKMFQEELMDGVFYTEVLIQKMENNDGSKSK